MAIRKIITSENEILRKVSKPVKVFDENWIDLIEDMNETLKKSGGVGLAAPQVAVLKRVVVIDLNGTHLELVNPEIVKTEGTQCEAEGCLSIPGHYQKVKRPMTVTVKAYDRYGNKLVITGEGFLARCFCHELDHLDGILFIDKAEKKVK